MTFFEGVVKEKGIAETFRAYAFHPDLFHRLFSGELHPIIHIGYGFEFQISLILAEGTLVLHGLIIIYSLGLAEAAVHDSRFENIIDQEFTSSQRTEKKTIINIIEESRSDKRFDSYLSYKDELKPKKLLKEHADVVKDYSSKWVITETEEGVKEATKELLDACILAYAASAVRPDKDVIRVDFFLYYYSV